MLATGIAKQLRYKAESSWAVAPGATGAQMLRRVSSDLALKKATFESGELVSTYQRTDYRHGGRSVTGTINGELSPGTYKDFVAAVLRRDYTAVTAMSALSVTVAGTGPTYTVARAAGSFLTDGVKVGHIVRLTAGSFNAANLNKNLLVTAVVALTLTVMPVNGVALVAEGPIASATISVPGKITYVPQTGHTDKSFAIEHWHADLAQSERFDGCKVNQLDVTVPPSGMVTIGLQFLGKDMTTNTSAYFTTPTGETTTGLLTGTCGLLLAQGAAIAVVTGINFSIKSNMTGENVVGSVNYADITEGRVLVDGQMTALFDGITLRDMFLNETEVSLVVCVAASLSASADFVTVTIPRVKFGDAAKDDGDKALVQTLPFTALENVSGGTGISTERTTINFQDSQA